VDLRSIAEKMPAGPMFTVEDIWVLRVWVYATSNQIGFLTFPGKALEKTRLLLGFLTFPGIFR